MSAIYNEIMREYDKQRLRNSAEHAKRLSEVYHLCPELKALEQELCESGLSVAKAMLSCVEDKEAYLYALKEKNLELRARRSKLLSELGFLPDYLEKRYSCLKCKDTGFADDAKCSCLKQKLIDRHSKISGLSVMHKQDSFKSFELKYYSDEPSKKSGVSDRKNMEKVLVACQGFVRRFGKGESLFLFGNTGLGKTLLCNAMANALLSKDKTVLYFTASQLFKLIEDQRFKKDDDADNKELADMIYTSELLIIDDLGTEFSTIITDTELYNILNIRLINLKSVIISTNLSHKSFIDHYEDRISSRVFGNYTLLEFCGEDIRMRKEFGL